MTALYEVTFVDGTKEAIEAMNEENSRFIQIGLSMMTTRMDTNCSSKHQTISLISI